MTDQSDDKTRLFKPVAIDSAIGQYKILDRLGAGATGEVFLADDTNLRRKAVLKFLSGLLASDPDARMRFLREARTAAKLNHRNIITIYEVSEIEKHVFIAMEWIEGCTLKDLLLKSRLSRNESIDLAIQICTGLAAAHEAGVVHRDVKPSNIYVDCEMTCKLLDFGLAKSRSEVTITDPGAVFGTINYMSPEQCRGETTDLRCDLFSLGVVLFEMLTGELPFKRDSAAATLYATLNDSPAPLTEYGYDRDDPLQDLLTRLMAKDRGGRPEGARIAMSALDSARKGAATDFKSSGKAKSGQQTIGLAVMYLRNLGNDDDEFLSYGITEDLIVDLTRLGTVRIIPMRSVLKYRESELSLKEVAEELDVTHVLDGSIQKSDSSIRTSAQLVEVQTGMNLWAGRWDEPLERLPYVKKSLADEIGKSLELGPAAAKDAGVGRIRTRNASAYEFYLRGKYAHRTGRSTVDIEVAHSLFEKALEIDPDLIAAESGIAEILILNCKLTEAEALLSKAIDKSQRLDSPADEACLLRILADLRCRQSRWDDAAASATKSVEISKSIGDLVGEGETLAIIVEILQRKAEFEKALELSHRIIEINRRLGDSEKVANSINKLGTTYISMGRFRESTEHYREALSIAIRRNDVSMQARCIANLGTASLLMGNKDESLAKFRESLILFEQIGDRSRQATMFNNMARVHLSRGEYGQAVDLYNKSLSIHVGFSDKCAEAMARNNLALVYSIVGSYDEAQAEVENSLQLSRSIDFPVVETASASIQGFIAFCNRNLESAEKLYRESLEVAQEHGLEYQASAAHFNIGELLYYSGQYDHAVPHFSTSDGLAEKLGLSHYRIKTRAYLAACEASLSNSDEKLDRLVSLLLEAERDGNPVYILLTKRLLAQTKLKYEASAKSRKEAIRMLEDAMQYSMEVGIEYETRWIREILDSFSAASS